LIKRLEQVVALVLHQRWVSDGPRAARGPSTHFNRPATCTANGPWTAFCVVYLHTYCFKDLDISRTDNLLNYCRSGSSRL